MPKPKIYFAASIRAGRDDQPLYAQIIELLKAHGVVLSEHFGSATLTSQGHQHPVQAIYQQDKSWVREADIVVAEVSTPSLGVGMELGWAEEWGKRVVCLYREQEGKRLSALVDGAPNFTVFRYQTIEDVQKILVDNL